MFLNLEESFKKCFNWFQVRFFIRTDNRVTIVCLLNNKVVLICTVIQIHPYLSSLCKLSQCKLTTCNLKIVFTSPIWVKSFFTFKDKLPKMLLSGLVYKHKCGGCNATYHGKTKRCFKAWICEHLGISHLTGKKVKVDKNKLIAIQEHLLCCN